MVLDRPNPLGGVLVDGPMLNMSCCQSGYGKHPSTHVHGMTIAELGSMFNQQAVHIPSSYFVTVSMRHYRRDMSWSHTGLPWVPPSPNIPTPTSAAAYPATVFLEATSASEGRGTTTPFEMFGAPFVDPVQFSSALRSRLSLPLDNPRQPAFRMSFFQPTFSKYSGYGSPGRAVAHGEAGRGAAVPSGRGGAAGTEEIG